MSNQLSDTQQVEISIHCIILPISELNKLKQERDEFQKEVERLKIENNTLIIQIEENRKLRIDIQETIKQQEEKINI